MKVFVQIVDTRTEIYQCGGIEEPVQKGQEVANALGHFGIRIGDVEWQYRADDKMVGAVRDTTKVVSVICCSH